VAQIAYKGAGAAVSANGTAALTPAMPATVDAGDIVLLAIQYRGTADSPSPAAVAG
jgi:hypothetical protein